jgi:hypothetical protein
MIYSSLVLHCTTCTPTAADFDRHFPREHILSANSEGLSLCTCPTCRKVFARYWSEAAGWSDGQDKIRHWWVPVTATQADALRHDPASIEQLIRFTPHWAKDANSPYARRTVSVFSSPSLPPI